MATYMTPEAFADLNRRLEARREAIAELRCQLGEATTLAEKLAIRRRLDAARSTQPWDPDHMAPPRRGT